MTTTVRRGRTTGSQPQRFSTTMTGLACRCLLSLFAVAAATSAASCPDNWVYNPDHNTCVKGVESRVDWFQARDSCADDKSTLLHVDSDVIRQFIADNEVLSSGTSYWTAANDILEEDSIRSVFGHSMAFIAWDSGQPNDAEQDGGPHTQNCVMDVVTDSHRQEDKGCDSNTFRYICEMWPREVYQAQFERVSMSTPSFTNYGLTTDDDLQQVPTKRACAALCLQNFEFCEVYVHNSQSKRCKLLRLYEEGHSNALTRDMVDDLVDAGYSAFRLERMVV